MKLKSVIVLSLLLLFSLGSLAIGAPAPQNNNRPTMERKNGDSNRHGRRRHRRRHRRHRKHTM